MAFDCDRRGATVYLVLREVGAGFFFFPAVFEADFADVAAVLPLKI
jgi:hypothetical protein